jgi:hypothetical protein
MQDFFCAKWYYAGVPSSFVSTKLCILGMAEAMKWRNGR